MYAVQRFTSTFSKTKIKPEKRRDKYAIHIAPF